MFRRAWLLLTVIVLVSLMSGCPRTTTETPQPAQNSAEVIQGTASPAGESPEVQNAEPAPADVVTDQPAGGSTNEKPATKASSVTDWKTYTGAWFKVRYPASFEVVAREESSTSSEGNDGVSFVSPDGSIEFYVFSPQWSGESQWIHAKEGEAKTESSTEAEGSQTTTWVTLAGPDGAYERSYADTFDSTLNTRHIFGFRYPSKAAYGEWKEIYVKFKQSLEQFAD
ncbi:MAG: hypothetical protein ABFE16_06970 [Armatimonadia bacterium]